MSLRTRLAAVLCLLLSLHLAVLQSWHTHSAPATLFTSAQHTLSASTADPADSACPACAALHLAPLSVAVTQGAALAITGTPAPSHRLLPAPTPQHFPQYSRPPPHA